MTEASDYENLNSTTSIDLGVNTLQSLNLVGSPTLDYNPYQDHPLQTIEKHQVTPETKTQRMLVGIANRMLYSQAVQLETLYSHEKEQVSKAAEERIYGTLLSGIENRVIQHHHDPEFDPKNPVSEELVRPVDYSIQPRTRHQKNKVLRTDFRQKKIQSERSRRQYNLRLVYGETIADVDFIDRSKKENLSKKALRNRKKAKREYDKSVRKAGSGLLHDNNVSVRNNPELDLQHIQLGSIERKNLQTPRHNRVKHALVSGAYRGTAFVDMAINYVGEVANVWNQDYITRTNEKIDNNIDSKLNSHRTKRVRRKEHSNNQRRVKLTKRYSRVHRTLRSSRMILG